jgi:hypothetical protein
MLFLVGMHLRPTVRPNFSCVNTVLLLVTIQARRKSEEQADEIGKLEMSAIYAEMASCLQLTIAQYMGV